MLDQLAVNSWLDDFVTKLRNAFGDRLVFVGHHGSWARGEAVGGSDIDAIVVLDRIEPRDLVTYRSVVDSMPDGGLAASGVLNSVPEMRSLPPAGLLECFQGCQVLHGSLDGVVECPDASDLIEDARRKASDNLSAARHYLLYPHDLTQKVHALQYPFKYCVYALQAWMLAQTGRFIARKADLLAALDDADDRSVIVVAKDWRDSREDREARPRYYVELLERWSRKMLLRLGEASPPGTRASRGDASQACTTRCAGELGRAGREPIAWEQSYEGQLRKLVGNRRLIIPASRSVVMDGQGRILLVRRRESGEWGFPAGAVELGESVLDCCKREVKEETGLDVSTAEPIAIYSEPRFQWTDRYGNQRQMLTIVLLVREWSGQISTRTDETTDCRFFEMADLPSLPPVYAEAVDDLRNFKGSLILK